MIIMKKMKGKYCAYAPVVRDNGMGLGLACFKEKGYYILDNEGYFPTWDAAQEKATERNHNVLDVTKEQAHLIVMTSMFPDSPITLEEIEKKG